MDLTEALPGKLFFMDNFNSKRRLSPLAAAMLAQLAAAVLTLGGSWGAVVVFGKVPPLAPVLFVQGGLAGWLGHRFGLERWWLPVQLLFAPALALGMWLSPPSWIYPAAFVGLVLVYWNSAGERVPLYLTNRATWAALAGLLPAKADLVFVDIGCGFGGVIAFLARSRPQGRFYGIESAPVPFAVSWLRLKLCGPPNARLIYGDYWKADLSRYDVVYCFLSPAPMPDLYRKVRAEMRPGSVFISNSFEVPDFPADEIVTVNDRRRTRLHVWRIN